MLKAKRDGTIIRIEIDTMTGFPIHIWKFEWESHYEASAQVMADHLNNVFRETIEKIREEAYNQGWKDKAGKKVRKMSTFHGHFKTTGVVGH